MSIANTIRKVKETLLRLTGTLQTDLAGLRQKIADLHTEIGHVARSPLPVQEVVETCIPGVVAEAAHYWRREHGDSLIIGPQSLASPTATGSRILPWSLIEPLSWCAICAADPAGAARILEGLVKSIQYTAGPPASERPELLARLQAELAEMERAEEELVDAANAAGVAVGHRTEVVQRRNAEAERIRRETDAAERRRALEEQANQQHGARRTLAPSRYIETGRLDG